MDALVFVIFDVVSRLQDFLDAGGPVLRVIAVVIFLMWALILERGYYLWKVLPRIELRVQRAWNQRADHSSWRAHQIRRAMLASVQQDAQSFLPTIKTLIALCPMFGLVGTVTGMIVVFDVMSYTGMGNPRLMADGISQATIPTMGGMVGALSGIFMISYLETQIRHRLNLLEDHLETTHDPARAESC